jgi:hypothetical protein
MATRRGSASRGLGFPLSPPGPGYGARFRARAPPRSLLAFEELRARSWYLKGASFGFDGSLFFLRISMAHPERLELPTNWFEASYSIQLSYGCA